MTAFSERQRFALWVYVLVVAIMCVSTSAFIAEAFKSSGEPGLPAIAFITTALFLFLFDVLALWSEVRGDAVCVQLGRPVPIIWKRIPLTTIRATRVVAYRPLLDAGGWGMRFGRFERRFTIYWNARGNRGVLIETDARRYIIGSQDPEALRAAIERACNRPPRADSDSH